MINWLVALKEAAVAVHRDESGQDLIEYALVAALIALAAIIGMQTVANAINAAFIAVGSRLGTYVS
jgi:pilus assembly protein Flp/PilA